jgi:pilus assembly protein FimV
VKAAPTPAPAPAAAEPSLTDTLTSPYVLGGIIAALLTLLVGLNLYRKRKVEKSDEFKATGEGMQANSLFGATGGQSVDTGATSTFNSSFIPAASQLDSNEVDPVAEADVYIAYGREEQAEDILKEALRLQPDRHAVRVKLLEIYSRRNDKASFMAVAQELRERTGGVGEDWERAAKLGRALDPNEPMFAGAVTADMARGPTTELRLDPAASSRPITLGGIPAAVGSAAAIPEMKEPADLPFTASLNVPTRGGPDTRMTPDTAMPLDSRMGGDTRQGAAPITTTGPTTRFEATLSPSTIPMDPAKADILAPAASSNVDFSALDFDLGSPSTRMPEGPATAMPQPTAFDLSFDAKPAAFEPPKVEANTAPTRPMAAPTVGGFGSIPDVDFSLPSKTVTSAPAFTESMSSAPASVQSALEESLARPTLLGDVGALPDERAPRLTSNTDQATVPLIDFDLTGSDVELGGRRTETQAGSPLAAQMATKLDLARGYIDLGVKDGARELLEEVMRDGTREQRQSAVELMKQVES